MPQVCSAGLVFLGRKVTRFAAITMLGFGLSVLAPRSPAQEVPREVLAKARFLTVVPAYVQWPAGTFTSPEMTVRLCVYGDYPFGISLADLSRSARINGHRMEVKRIGKEEELAGCQMLFVSRSAAKQYATILGAVKNSITLTIGEDSDFLAAGGMLRVEEAGNGVAFDVNLEAVNHGHLKLSSQMLSLARRIVERSEQARG